MTTPQTGSAGLSVSQGNSLARGACRFRTTAVPGVELAKAASLARRCLKLEGMISTERTENSRAPGRPERTSVDISTRARQTTQSARNSRQQQIFAIRRFL